MTGLHDTGSTCQTSLCGAAGHFLLIMVPLGTVTLVEQPVLHLLAPHQPFPLDDQRWVHDARCPASAPPAHSGWSPHVRRARSCVWMVPMDVP